MIRLLKSLFRKRRADTEDGGVRKRIWYDAPKKIVSEQIISFKCEFSTVTIVDDIPIEHGVYTLFARLKDGAVRGAYELRTRDGSGEQFDFRQSHRFLRSVQNVVSTYDIAKHNGMEYRVSGLPDMYGANISIVYASGERIYASDNQNNFLSVEAMAELVKLFLQQK
ncbi:MAG: hypothetical protein E7598_01175 [Ruminococcaceae bacterium]|nr:hypothetical protein [Oscillospiraceae bacterium]